MPTEVVSPAPKWVVVAAVLAAASLCMVATGYSFLAGNHEVYLLDPLRRAGLATFAGDWFVNDTLQYHGLFSLVAAGLFKLNVATVGFLVAFLTLVLATAWAWWRITRSLGGGVAAFLASVVAYHVLLGDRALGFYSLLQDGQFNAGNVAAVSLLVGIAMWLERQLVLAGVAFGAAGAFHLNYAVVCPALWVALLLWSGGPWPAFLAPRNAGQGPPLRRMVLATGLALLPSIANVAFALPAKVGRDASGDLPLGEFVQLYVKLRHPHHYDPSAWPWWVWTAFLLPIPLAVLAWRRNRTSPAWDEAAKVWLLLMGLQLAALLFAGVWYVSETAIQMSLWRFSPHAKLLAVTGACVWALGPVAQPRRPRRGLAEASAAIVAFALVVAAGAIGRLTPPGQPMPNRAVIEAAAWARANTDPNATFLVPPGVGSAWPVNSRRGHVVSFKLVPQLSNELGDWDRRLREVLAVDDLSPYVGGLTGYRTAQAGMDLRNGELSAAHLFGVAERFGARYVLTLKPLADAPSSAAVWRGRDGATIYDRRRSVSLGASEGLVGTGFDPRPATDASH